MLLFNMLSVMLMGLTVVSCRSWEAYCQFKQDEDVPFLCKWHEENDDE